VPDTKKLELGVIVPLVRVNVPPVVTVNVVQVITPMLDNKLVAPWYVTLLEQVKLNVAKLIVPAV